MVKYVETEAGPEDADRQLVFNALAGDGVWLFITAEFSGDDEGDASIDLKIETSEVISDSALLRSMLEKTLAALP
jgi:hypothetical protein